MLFHIGAKTGIPFAKNIPLQYFDRAEKVSRGKDHFLARSTR
jgi:hypothetical protein